MTELSRALRELDDAQAEVLAARMRLEAAKRHISQAWEILRKLHSLEDTTPLHGKKPDGA